MIEKVNVVFQDCLETEFGTIFIPTIKDYLKLGDEGIAELVLPYRMSLDLLQLDEETKEQVKVFDLFFQDFQYNDTKSYHDILITSLQFFFREEPVFDWNNYSVKIGGFFINRDNYDDLADIVLLINSAERIKKEKEPVFKNEAQRDVFYKIQEGRRKKEEKNRISIATMMNCVVHGGKSFVSYKEVSSMTLPQLTNSFSAITGIDSWEMDFDKYLVGVEPKKLDLTYWIFKIKL